MKDKLVEKESGWLVEVINWVIDHTYDEAREYAEDLKKNNPKMNLDELADECINDDALWAGVVGVGMGALQSIPGIGQAVAVVSIAREVVYLTKFQVEGIIKIAFIYNRRISKDKLKYLVLSCLTIYLGGDFLKQVAKESSIRLTKRLIIKHIKGATLKMIKKIAMKFGIKFTKKGILKRIPLVAIPINAVMNYTEIKAGGKIAKKFLSPNYIMCPNCGELYPKRNKFCDKCGAPRPKRFWFF